MTGDRIDWERLDRFILGEGSPEERAALDHWVNADPLRRALADAMRGVNAAPDSRSWNAVGALRNVQRRLEMTGRNASSPIIRPRSKVRRALARLLMVTGAAAAVVLGILWRNLTPTQPADVSLRVWVTAWTR